MDPRVLKVINAEIRARRAVMRVTQLDDGRDRAVRKGEVVAGELGAAIRHAFRTGHSMQVAADGAQWFLNVFLPLPRLVITGAVHITQALAPMAQISGFEVVIIDPRSAFASPARFPGARTVPDWPQTVLAADPLDEFSALAALAHDPKIDDPALVAALAANCFHIGALGSRKTHARRVERLQAAGVSAGQIERIEAPIGLDIGAANPSEIAVAILASTIASLRRDRPDTGA